MFEKSKSSMTMNLVFHSPLSPHAVWPSQLFASMQKVLFCGYVYIVTSKYYYLVKEFK